MACLPIASRDEAKVLAPFVEHLNQSMGSHFVFDHRLDLTGPRSAPEALYIDNASAAQLVIERKNLVWPIDFAKVHASVHEMEAIIRTIVTPSLDPTRPYELRMPGNPKGGRNQLREAAAAIGTTIVQRMTAANAGEVIRPNTLAFPWAFRAQHASERDYDQPQAGLGVDFTILPSEVDYGVVPIELAGSFQRLLDATARKFDSFDRAVRVLVIDPIGDVRWSPTSYWTSLLEAVMVPNAISQIWCSMHDMITDLACGWMHHQVFPDAAEPAYVLCAG